MTAPQHRADARRSAGRPAKGVVRDGEGRVVVEYLATRGVVRVFADPAAGGPTTELPLDSFISELGLDVALRQERPSYLLVSSEAVSAPRSPGEVVRAFASEGQAKEAFRRARLAPESRQGWAELLVVNNGVLAPLRWFGFPLGPTRPPAAEPGRPAGRSARARSRGLRRLVGLRFPSASTGGTVSEEVRR